MMKRLLVVAAITLCVCRAAWAQNTAPQTAAREENVAADFAEPSAGGFLQPIRIQKSPFPQFTKAIEVSSFNPEGKSENSFLTGLHDSRSISFSGATSALPRGEAEAAPAAPDPRFVFGGRDDFRFQLALGLSFVRFRSSRYFASAVGTSTSLTYFTNEWFGFEGSIITAFAPTINLNEHIKYVEYGAGPKISWRRARFEPWVHALVGGAHVFPQVPDFSKNAPGFQTGGGLDYRLDPRFSVRLELDWISTHFWGEWQNSGQATLQGVIHF